MYVLSQDGKILTKIQCLAVTRNFGGKDKYAITDNTYVLGLFAEEKLAILELEHVYEAMRNGEKVYRIGMSDQ